MNLRLGKRRAGISELVASVVTIAITIIAGASVFGYVNGQAGASERQYGISAGQTNNYLSEKFVVTLMTFASGPPPTVTAWMYNSGSINFQPVQVEFYNVTSSCTKSCTSLDLQYTASGVADVNHPGCTAPNTNENPLFSSVNLSPNALLQLVLTIPNNFVGTGCVNNYLLSVGGVYYVTVLGYYGNVVSYFQVKGH